MNFEFLSEINDRIGEHIVRRSFWLKTLAGFLVVAVCAGAAFYYWPEQSKAASAGPRFAAASGDCTNSGTWTNPGNAFSDNATDATVSVDGSSSGVLMCKNFGFTTGMIPTGSTIDGVVITIERMSSSTNNGGSSDSALYLTKDGTNNVGSSRHTGTTYTTSMVAEDHGGNTDLWGTTLSISDVTSANFGVRFSTNKPASAGAAHTVSVDYISITVYFSPPPPVLTQRNYIFEQDDGANVNSNADNGIVNTALTGVKKGERLNARIQVDNTGTSDFTNGQFELFYDRNDGVWTRVGNRSDSSEYPSGSNCTDSQWICEVVQGTGNELYIHEGSLAVSPSGQPWFSYYSATTLSLHVAQYVGSGGTGCLSAKWTCVTIEDGADSVGHENSLAFDAKGTPWISYYDSTNTALRVAKFVGSGGTGCATSSAWSCTTVDNPTNSVGSISSIAVNSLGNPAIAYRDSTAGSIMMAEYVGASGTGCTSSEWSCITVHDDADTYGFNTISLSISADDKKWVSYRNSTDNSLMVAEEVGTGGTGCTSTTKWSCLVVDDPTNTVGKGSSLAIDYSGNPVVSYWDDTADDIKVAQYVGSGGTGCTSGTNNAAWDCMILDDVVTAAALPSSAIAISDVGDNPWVVYDEGDTDVVMIAHYVGSGGTGCSTAAWTCTTLQDATEQLGSPASIAIAADGTPWIAYKHDTFGFDDIGVASLKLKKEIFAGQGLSGSIGDVLTTNAAGSCAGGTTFENGIWHEGVNISKSQTLAASKCTELAFMVDTAQAEAGMTYRLALKDKTNNRGLSAYSNYPTFTIVSAGNDTVRASKDVIARLGSPTACTNTDYDCEDVDDHASESIGFQAYIDLGPDGNPWISYRNTTQGSLMLAKYVGSGGSGCNGGNTKWNCEVVDSTGIDAVYATSLKVDAAGKAWISSFDRVNEDVRIAEHVGSGGSGCGGGNTAWNCYTLYDATVNSDGHMHPNMTLDSNGMPWISFALDTNTSSALYDYELMVARYVGSGGTGCTSAAWTCELVDGSSGDVGTFSAIAINPKTSKPWISYFERGNWNLRVAEYVGSGGSGCSGSATWTCTVVHSTNDAGSYTSIALDNDGNPWVAYYESVGLDIYVANYVGSGGSGCAVSSWSCVRVDGASTTVGLEHGKRWLAMDPEGNPWLTYRDNTSSSNLLLKAARYVGSGGSGCDSSAWSCSIITNGGSVGIDHHSSLVFDASGALWLAFRNNNNASLRVAKTVYPPFSTKARYSLDGQGYTYAGTDDTSFDQMASGTHTPLYRFSTKHANNTTNIQPTWIGKSDVAAGTNNIKAQVYRFGTTNDWVDMATNSSCSANTDCTITPTAISTNLSEYYEAEGSSYLLHFRVHQVAGTTKTLQTDCFSAATGCSGGGGPTPTPTPQMDQRLQRGNWWLDGVRQFLHLD